MSQLRYGVSSPQRSTLAVSDGPAAAGGSNAKARGPRVTVGRITPERSSACDAAPPASRHRSAQCRLHSRPTNLAAAALWPVAEYSQRPRVSVRHGVRFDEIQELLLVDRSAAVAVDLVEKVDHLVWTGGRNGHSIARSIGPLACTRVHAHTCAHAHLLQVPRCAEALQDFLDLWQRL